MATVMKNKMGTEPVGKLLFSTALPLIISMLVQALYNMVDSLFVSQLSQEAFNAVSMAFPVQNIMIAIATGTGVGVVALISKSLGEKNQEKANKLATNGVFLALCSYLIMLVFGLVGTEFFFKTQTKIPAIIEGGKEYLTICCVFSFGLFGQVILEKLMQSTGKAGLSMWTQLVGAVVNIVLDPVLIFGWGFFPKMGVAGAAVATVVGQICSMVVGIILHQRFNKALRLQYKGFRPDGRMIAAIYKIGVPSMLTMGIGSIMTFMMNRLLVDIEPTATAAAVFGAYFKVQSFFVMPVLGLANAMNPIVAYNLGAKSKKRMLKTYHLSVHWALGIMALATLSFLLIPNVLLKIFNASPHMLEIGVPAFQKISAAYVVAAYGIVTSQFFIACGKSLLALLMSAARQLVILIPVAYLFGYTLGYEYVWYALPIGELGSTAMAVYGRIRMQRRLFNQMPDAPLETLEETVIKPSVPGTIITIAREHGTQGKQIGRLVAEKLGVPFYDKELAALAAQESGLDREFISKINRNAPARLRELYLSTAAVAEAIVAQDRIIKRIAENGACVIVGRAADYVLREREDVVKVYLHAPVEYRVQKVMEMYGDNEQEAVKHVQRADTARAAYYESISGNTWGAAEHYDVTLNCENGIEATAEKLIKLIQKGNG